MEKVSGYKNKLLWIELLRVLSMLWIIAFHFSDHGTVDMSQAEISFNWVVMAFFRLGGGIGNCIFLLISGYLLYDKDFKIKRLIKLYCEVYFYSITIMLICMIFKINEISIMDIVRSFLPISGNRYWFISSYMVLSLLSPFINKVIGKTDFNAHIALIFILFIFSSVIPTFTGADWANSGGCIEIFVMLYLVGALIKKYDLFNLNACKYFFVFLFLIITMLLSEILLKKFTTVDFAYFVWTMKKTPVIVAAIILFVCVKNTCFHIPNLIPWFSENVFGVYLIHIGKISPLFFNLLFDVSEIYNSNLFIIYMVLFVLCIFIICTICDKLRICTVERTYTPLINIFSEKINRLFPLIIGKFYLIIK